MNDDNYKLFCGNLNPNVTEHLLEELFLQAGPLRGVKIPTPKPGYHYKFSFIEFQHECSVRYAIQLFKGTSLFGQMLLMNPRNSNTCGQQQQRGHVAMQHYLPNKVNIMAGNPQMVSLRSPVDCPLTPHQMQLPWPPALVSSPNMNPFLGNQHQANMLPTPLRHVTGVSLPIPTGETHSFRVESQHQGGTPHLKRLHDDSYGRNDHQPFDKRSRYSSPFSSIPCSRLSRGENSSFSESDGHEGSTSTFANMEIGVDYREDNELQASIRASLDDVVPWTIDSRPTTVDLSLLEASETSSSDNHSNQAMDSSDGNNLTFDTTLMAKSRRHHVRYMNIASDPGVKSEPHEGLDIVEVDPNGIFIRLQNKTNQVVPLRDALLEHKTQHICPGKRIVHKFARQFHVPAGTTVTVWSTGASVHKPPSDVVMTNQEWPVGEIMKTTLSNKSGKEIAKRVSKFILVPGESPNLFYLDTIPDVSEDKPPKYHDEFNAIFWTGNDVNQWDLKETSRPMNRCFNCQGDHTLSACVNPRDPHTIAKNREAFMARQSNMDVRYHFDGPSDFKHVIKSGLLSHGLRTALGLSASEIPLHIYRMRVFGYPPGWLEDIKSSYLRFIGDPDPFECEEDSVSYDVERIIDYPGFNVQLEQSYFDNWHNLNYPPMQNHHCKTEMVKQLKNCGKTPKSKSARLVRNIIPSQEKNNSSLNVPDQDVTRMNTSVEAPSRPVQSKLLLIGTPVSIGFSTFDTLPAREKFSKGLLAPPVEPDPVNSSGIYQKLRSLLQKRKNDLKK